MELMFMGTNVNVIGYVIKEVAYKFKYIIIL